jgi:hypothetical protein
MLTGPKRNDRLAVVWHQINRGTDIRFFDQSIDTKSSEALPTGFPNVVRIGLLVGFELLTKFAFLFIETALVGSNATDRTGGPHRKLEHNEGAEPNTHQRDDCIHFHEQSLQSSSQPIRVTRKLNPYDKLDIWRCNDLLGYQVIVDLSVELEKFGAITHKLNLHFFGQTKTDALLGKSLNPQEGDRDV